MNVFEDQATFMRACGQTVGKRDKAQFELYKNLICEEVEELLQACDAKDPVEMFDALLDIIVVCIGAGHSAGFPMEVGWDTVHLSNLRKIDPATGQVQRREDGKILKPAGWRAPDLKKVLENYGWESKA